MAAAKKDDDKKSERLAHFLRRGTAFLREGRSEEAVRLLKKAYAIDPSDVDVVLNLSGAYILSRRFKDAVPLLETMLEEDPHNAMLWTNVGAAYLGNPVLARDEEQLQAIVAFERALEIDPAAPHVAYNLGLIYRDRGNYPKAITWFQKALQANPNDRDAQRLIERLQRKLASDDSVA